jgi:predicted nucleic acid-binding protein
VKVVHLDTDFLIYAAARNGSERERLFELVDSDAVIHMSAWAWYEFRRGPRTPEQLALAAALIDEDGILPLTQEVAEQSAEVFRSLGSPRRRVAVVAIGVTAVSAGATLLTRNARDFNGIPDLEIAT